MSVSRSIAIAGIATAVLSASPRHDLPDARPNPNIDRAGRVERGVLTVALEAKESQWTAPGSHQRPLVLAAFSEAGKSPLLPGPFVRVSEGTEIRLSLHNTLPVPLTLLVPADIRGGSGDDAMDSVVVAPGSVRQMATRAAVPGNYVYRAIARDQASVVAEVTGALAGAIVVDSAGAVREPRDRVFVIMALPDSQWVAFVDAVGPEALSQRAALVRGAKGQFTYTINGRTWPNTERIHATAGDTLHWRVINASGQVHPMHLHGFYYRVDALTGGLSARFPRPLPGQWVVTQLVAPRASLSMTWSPDRPGNWLFHCHFAVHLLNDAWLDAPNAGQQGGMSAMQDMSGMVLGVLVADRRGTRPAGIQSAPARHLRLIAEPGPAPGGDAAQDTVPSMHFALDEGGRRVEGTPEQSPELDLTRGEPVSITIVNHLAEATSVHWHGIEVEDSYVDGVPGFSGSGNHLAPEIAPGDSFTVRFTPPRAGTFMYHAHMDELREQLAGLAGPLIVRDSGATPNADDHTLFFKGLDDDPGFPLEINGKANPDTLVLRAGRPARLRLLNLATVNVAPVFSLTARPDSASTAVPDTMVVAWRPLAKDGFDLPPTAQRIRPARQIVAVGETYDFEYRPSKPGNLRLEVHIRAPGAPPIISVPVRVE